MKSVLIAGYYGYDLIGDEAILEAMLNDLRKLRPDLRFIVTSQSPEKTKADYNVETIPLCDTKAIIDMIEECDLVIVGGGGVFNEYAPWRSDGLLTLHPDFNVFCASLPLLAAAYSKPCMIYAVGVEPLYSPSAKEQVANAFIAATRATVRDKGSLEILRTIGVPVEKVEVTADPAFRLPNANLPIEKTVGWQNLDAARPLLGVQLRHWNPRVWDLSGDPNSWEFEVAKALDGFVERTGANILFIPFQQREGWAFSDDRPVLMRVQDGMKHGSKTYLLEGHLRPGEISSLFGSCDMILAMRFHSVVLSIKNCVPCVAIAYSLKVKTAMTSAGLSKFSLDLEALNAQDILTKLLECYYRKEEIKRNLEIVSKEMATLAMRNAELAMELLDGQAWSPFSCSGFSELAVPLVARQTKLLVKREGEIETLRTELAGKDEIILSLQQQVSQLSDKIKTLEGALKEKEDALASLRSQLTSIYNSRRWKLATWLALAYWKKREVLNSVNFKRGR